MLTKLFPALTLQVSPLKNKHKNSTIRVTTYINKIYSVGIDNTITIAILAAKWLSNSSFISKVAGSILSKVFSM